MTCFGSVTFFLFIHSRASFSVRKALCSAEHPVTRGCASPLSESNQYLSHHTVTKWQVLGQEDRRRVNAPTNDNVVLVILATL